MSPDLIGTIVTVVVATVGATLWITRRLDRVERRLDGLELRVGALEQQSRSLLDAFRELLLTLMTAQGLPIDQGLRIMGIGLKAPDIEGLVRALRASRNPLTEDDIGRLRAYVARAGAGERLTVAEAEDFYRLAEIVTHEYPAQPGTWTLWLIAGVILGLVIADSNPRR